MSRISIAFYCCCATINMVNKDLQNEVVLLEVLEE